MENTNKNKNKNETEIGSTVMLKYVNTAQMNFTQ